ncbi:hypothetical protein WR25_20803 [Diploscapter pachys]|uniref:Uncharacterized protein n=1 Tax=Diploscapter pachys TaxID=2018661 RepID=A0A2A2K5H5_9BILA|nr:hypothetical protein WR25_20803 [Diploscapter pachys]
MFRHRPRDALPARRFGRDIARIGDMRAAARLIGLYVITAQQHAIALGHEHLMRRREPMDLPRGGPEGNPVVRDPLRRPGRDISAVAVGERPHLGGEAGCDGRHPRIGARAQPRIEQRILLREMRQQLAGQQPPRLPQCRQIGLRRRHTGQQRCSQLAQLVMLGGQSPPAQHEPSPHISRRIKY